MIDKEMKNLNRILIKIKSDTEDEGKYQELLDHSYINNIVNSTAIRIMKENNYDLDMDEVTNKVILTLFDMCDEFNYSSDDEYMSASFISYLYQYLYRRVYGEKEDYTSMFQNGVCSYDAIKFPIELLSENLQYKNFEEDAINRMCIQEVIEEELSERESKIIDLLFFKQYKPKEVALELDISPKTVHTYKYRAFEKIRNFL